MTLGVRSFKYLLCIEILADLPPYCFCVHSVPSFWSLHEHLCSGSLSAGLVCWDSLAVHVLRVMLTWFNARRWDSWLSRLPFAWYRRGIQVSCRRKMIRDESIWMELQVAPFWFLEVFTKCQILLSNFDLVWIEGHSNVKRTRINLVEAAACYEDFWVEDLIDKINIAQLYSPFCLKLERWRQ